MAELSLNNNHSLMYIITFIVHYHINVVDLDLYATLSYFCWKVHVFPTTMDIIRS